MTTNTLCQVRTIKVVADGKLHTIRGFTIPAVPGDISFNYNAIRLLETVRFPDTAAALLTLLLLTLLLLMCRRCNNCSPKLL